MFSWGKAYDDNVVDEPQQNAYDPEPTEIKPVSVANDKAWTTNEQSLEKEKRRQRRIERQEKRNMERRRQNTNRENRIRYNTSNSNQNKTTHNYSNSSSSNRTSNRNMNSNGMSVKNDYSNYTREEKVQQMGSLQERTTESLDRALATAAQTEYIGADTMETLHYQGKQLKKIDNMLDETDENLNQTQHTLNGMKSIFGQVSNWFKKTPQHSKRNSNSNNNNNSNNKNGNDKEKNDSNFNKVRTQAMVNARISQRMENNESKNVNKDDDVKLDELLASVKRMGVMADEINNELSNQSQLIDRIDGKMEVVDQKMKNQTVTMRRIT